ncbi:YggS family pyridoxal phosphate-dependent enzyme [Pelagibacterales bacterium SAG-MED11]|nr:YggS family pyridoxal phosphate-dependent enzyme [Pelagibacterales bacterium SAG-MED11]
MHSTVKNLLYIKNNIKVYLEKLNINNDPKILAVSKTFEINNILPLIEYGHLDYGENKVQEALEKWSDIKLIKKDLKLHLIGKLQTNKVKQAIKIFDYIHSVDSEKLAKKIADEETKQGKKIKIFIQVNIGDEEQKSGVNKSSVNELYSYCKAIDLNVIGLMCIPPLGKSSDIFFKEMRTLNKNLNLDELSMGMSADYLDAIKNSATYVRIGSNIFGERS